MGLLVLAAAVFAAALLIGTSGISLRDALGVLLGAGDDAARTVLFEVRLPRLLAAFGVGGLLAVAVGRFARRARLRGPQAHAA